MTSSYYMIKGVKISKKMNKEIIRTIFGEEIIKKVEDSVCPFCNDKVEAVDFRDELSLKEFKISGLC